jgi:uncharacterized protein YnzC (UPF0291/DUF896 family)
MSAQSVTLRLPVSLYDLLRQRAQQTRRSLEAEILDLVTSAVRPDDDLPPDLREVVAPLRSLNDDALRRTAMDRFPEDAARRFTELNHKQQREGLTEEETSDLADLRRGYERFMVLRAEAAALLKERGYDVSKLILRR